MPKTRGARLPIDTVEGERFQRTDRALIETANVDAEPVRIRARYVERLDATHLAEHVLRDPGIESVGRKRILPFHDAKLARGHDQMQEARAFANRAIAFVGDDVFGCFGFEGYGAAMAASLMDHELLPGSEWNGTMLDQGGS